MMIPTYQTEKDGTKMESKLQKIEKMIAALQKEKGVNQRILLKMYIEKRNELKKQLNK